MTIADFSRVGTQAVTLSGHTQGTEAVTLSGHTQGAKVAQGAKGGAWGNGSRQARREDQEAHENNFLSKSIYVTLS